MKALVATGRMAEPVRFAEVEQPQPGPGEALVKVEAFSVNRGETFRPEAPRAGWRPGKDVAGLVVQGAADGSGPAAGRAAGAADRGLRGSGALRHRAGGRGKAVLTLA